MEFIEYEELHGGNMNIPLKKGNLIYKEAHSASETIHRLLCHVRNKGITWTPQSLGITEDGKHILSFIEGVVPNDCPDWLWEMNLLTEVATKLREWHDATEDFPLTNAQWLLHNDEPNEVVCHSDFAPYNCVFEHNQFKGLIDFDVCAPGSRLWDIAYAVYRFIPLLPQESINHAYETSPFSEDVIVKRLKTFLQYYSMDALHYHYTVSEVISKVKKRLHSLSEWSHDYGSKTTNDEILQHAEMYASHAHWVTSLIEAVEY